jgi:hypothetical protein
MKNNKVIGFMPKQASKIHGSTGTGKTYTDTVDHALKKFLTPEEFDKVINGYRRSPWSSEALNHDIQRLDSEYHSVLKDEHYYKALKKTAEIFSPKEKLHPIHFADLRHYKWELSTNVGAPFNTSPSWQTYVKWKLDPSTPLPPEYRQKFSDMRHHRDLFDEAHGTKLDQKDARMSKHNLYTEMFLVNRKHIHRIKSGETKSELGHDYKYWNTAFARQHLVEADEPDKVRLVFGAPSLLLMAELMFMWPLQISLLNRGSESPMLWGYETLLGGWNRLYAWACLKWAGFMSVFLLDWSGFDRFARHTVLDDLDQHVLRPMFDFSRYWPTHRNPNATPNPKETKNGFISGEQAIENIWNWVRDAILHTPLLLEDGTLIEFQHSGIFSGYFRTQILDSLYNTQMFLTILSRMGMDIDRIGFKVQGDDSIILLYFHFCSLIAMSFLTMFTYYAKFYFGSIVSEKKSSILPSLEGAEVLKYKNHAAMPYRDELALLAMLRFPERRSDLQSLKSRCIGIAYADCGVHPRVYQICEEIYSYLESEGNIIADPRGLPEGIRWRLRYQEPELAVDITRFPTWFETVRHLQDPERRLVTERHWPSKHFIGAPH